MRCHRLGSTALSPVCLIVSLFLLTNALLAQSFVQPKVIPTGDWPIAIYTADFNEDGISDLVYINHAANGSTVLHVLLNDGRGNFTESYSAADPFTSLAIGDLMGNGHVDIGYALPQGAGSGGTGIIIRIDAGLGNGTFINHQAVVPFAVNPTDTFAFFSAGRLTQGGPVDLIGEDTTTNTLFTFHANPTPASGSSSFPNGFISHVNINLPDGAGPVIVQDLNGDGNPELIVNGQTGFQAAIFTGAASGIATGASPALRIPGVSGVHSLLVQDLNKDGRPDMVVEGSNGHIDVFAGNGDGTFQTTSIGGSGSLDGTTGNGGRLISLGDFNKDGNPDALTATPTGISTLLGNGTGYLGLKGIYNAGPGRSAYAVADFNGDGNPDLAVDSPEGIAILYGNSDGSFRTNQAFASTKAALASATGNFSKSGKLDVVVVTATTQGQFFKGNGDGTFTVASGFTTTQAGDPTLFSTVQAGDFNGDGNLDLAFTATGLPLPLNPTTGLLNPGAPTGLQIQYGNGDGTFQSLAQVPQPNTGNSLYGYSVAGDFNGDGVADLFSVDPFTTTRCWA